jgi:hypothetical protein
MTIYDKNKAPLIVDQDTQYNLILEKKNKIEPDIDKK